MVEIIGWTTVECQRRTKNCISRPEQKYISKRRKKASRAGPCCVSRSGFGGVGGLGISAGAALTVFEPATVAIHLEDVNVVGEAIEQCAG
jgi:hypothetical protein